MPTETLTTFAKIKKWIKGDPNWHTLINGNMDLLDIIVGQSGADPNITTKEVLFIGQRFYQINAHAWWVGTTLGVPPTGVWTREIARGFVMAFPSTSPPLGWTLCDGSTVTVDTVALVTQDLRARKIVGYDPTDNDYDTIGAVAGSRTHTLITANLPLVSGNMFWKDNGTTLIPSGTLASVQVPAPGLKQLIGSASPTFIDHRDPETVLAWYAKL